MSIDSMGLTFNNVVYLSNRVNMIAFTDFKLVIEFVEELNGLTLGNRL